MSQHQDRDWLEPRDSHNARLKDLVFPGDWSVPQPTRPYHLVVIGAGTAGLVTAAGAAGLGARVALVEREHMGGDCLNVGCVPSKALIAAARAAATARRSSVLGIKTSEPTIDFAKVMERLRATRADIGPVDSASRFQSLGVDVFLGAATFRSPHQIEVTDPNGSVTTLEGRRMVIATGARPRIPAVPGLDDVPYLTNETLFTLTELPPRLGVIGGGPIGAEMAQAFARLGSQVTLVERGPQLLGREDSSAAGIVQQRIQAEGVTCWLDTSLESVRRSNGSIQLTLKSQQGQSNCEVDQLLIAVGRQPNLETLGLDRAGVGYSEKGIQVNDFLQTSHPAIYAAGDVASSFQFTHAADFQARIVIQNALFAWGPLGRRRASRLLVPHVTYTDPEVAGVGLNRRQAEQQGIPVDSFHLPLSELDRAILEGQTEGFLEIVTAQGKDRILGATMVGPHAGEWISEITMAMQQRIGLSRLAGIMHPYPTMASGLAKLGDQYNRGRLTPFSQRILDLLRWWNVGS